MNTTFAFILGLLIGGAISYFFACICIGKINNCINEAMKNLKRANELCQEMKDRECSCETLYCPPKVDTKA